MKDEDVKVFGNRTLSWHSSSPGSIWQPGGAHWKEGRNGHNVKKNGQMDSIQYIMHDHFQMKSIEYISHDQVKRDLHELLEVSRTPCRQQNCPDSAQGKHYKRDKQLINVIRQTYI